MAVGEISEVMGKGFYKFDGKLQIDRSKKLNQSQAEYTWIKSQWGTSQWNLKISRGWEGNHINTKKDKDDKKKITNALNLEVLC